MNVSAGVENNLSRLDLSISLMDFDVIQTDRQDLSIRPLCIGTIHTHHTTEMATAKSSSSAKHPCQIIHCQKRPPHG